jgi:hypothetical protein
MHSACEMVHSIAGGIHKQFVMNEVCLDGDGSMRS